MPVGSDVMKPIAAPIIGGVITSTIHVLVITPVVFYIMKPRALRLMPESRRSPQRTVRRASIANRCNDLQAGTGGANPPAEWRMHAGRVGGSRAAAHGRVTERATRTCGYSGRRPDPCVLHEGITASHGIERAGLLPDPQCDSGSSRGVATEDGDSHSTRNRRHPKQDALDGRRTPTARPGSACT